jgi:hypothetical protein
MFLMAVSRRSLNKPLRQSAATSWAIKVSGRQRHWASAFTPPATRAVRPVVRTWTVELKDRRIRSNVLSSGPVVAPQVPLQPPEAMARNVSTLPISRIAEPIAKIALFPLCHGDQIVRRCRKSDARTNHVQDCSR